MINTLVISVLFINLIINIKFLFKFNNLSEVSPILLGYFLFGSSIVTILSGYFVVGALIGYCLLIFTSLFYSQRFINTYRSNWQILIFLIIIGFYFMFSLLINGAPFYGTIKSIEYVVLISVFFIALTQLKNLLSIQKFIYFSNIFIISYLIIIVITLDPFNNTILTSTYRAGEDRIILSRFLIIGLIFTWYIIIDNKKLLGKILVLNIPIYIGLLLTAGARGPILSLIIALLFVTFKNQIKFYWLFLGFFFAFILYYKFAEFFMNNFLFFTRNLSLAEIGQHGERRFELIIQLLDYFKNIDVWQFIFGVGFGNSFSVIGMNYPHNMFIELFVELGIVGISVSLYLFYFILIQIWNIHRSNIGVVILLSFLMYYISSMMSGKLTTNYSLFIFLALLINYNFSYKKLACFK